MKNIKEVSDLTGLSERTLRYYESLNLVEPKRNLNNQYREYSDKDIDTLYQIQLYRALAFPLKKIRQIFSEGLMSDRDIFMSQYESLLEKRADLDKVISNLEDKMNGDKEMKEKFEKVNKIVEENEKKYGQEIREKYGDATIDQANEYFIEGGDEKLVRIEELNEKIASLLTALVEEEASLDDPRAVQLFDAHKEWLQIYYPAYSSQYHLGLADMYEADERFAAYYNNIVAGGCDYQVSVIRKYAK